MNVIKIILTNSFSFKMHQIQLGPQRFQISSWIGEKERRKGWKGKQEGYDGEKKGKERGEVEKRKEKGERKIFSVPSFFSACSLSTNNIRAS